MGLACARHGATKATSFSLTSIPTHPPCIALPGPSLAIELLEGGMLQVTPLCSQEAQPHGQHPTRYWGWVLYGCSALGRCLGTARQEGAGGTSPPCPFLGCSGAAASAGARSGSEPPPGCSAGSRTVAASHFSFSAPKPLSLSFHFGFTSPPPETRRGICFGETVCSKRV